MVSNFIFEEVKFGKIYLEQINTCEPDCLSKGRLLKGNDKKTVERGHIACQNSLYFVLFLYHNKLVQNCY